jgi:EpsI family protein
MDRLKRYLPAIVLFGGAAFVVNMRSQAAIPLAAPLTGVLSVMPGYAAHDQVLSAEEQQVAGMSEYVARTYSRDTAVAFTTFVSYYERQTQGKTIHSPRNCLPGAGWGILSAGTQDLVVAGEKRTVNHYLLRNGPATAVVFYWYQGRGRIVANEYAVKWNLLRDAAIAGHTEEALVRVVVPVSPEPGDQSPDAPAKALDRANALGSAVAVRLAEDVSKVLPRSS